MCADLIVTLPSKSSRFFLHGFLYIFPPSTLLNLIFNHVEGLCHLFGSFLLISLVLFIDFSSENNKSNHNVDAGPISWLMDFLT